MELGVVGSEGMGLGEVAGKQFGRILALMVSTRGKGEVSTGTNHLGFRTVRSAKNLTTETR